MKFEIPARQRQFLINPLLQILMHALPLHKTCCSWWESAFRKFWNVGVEFLNFDFGICLGSRFALGSDGDSCNHFHLKFVARGESANVSEIFLDPSSGTCFRIAVMLMSKCESRNASWGNMLSDKLSFWMQPAWNPKCWQGRTRSIIQIVIWAAIMLMSRHESESLQFGNMFLGFPNKTCP